MKRKWFRLDNAALIFPAVMRRDWSNAFRLSAEFPDAIDPEMLEQAVNSLRRRFPTFFVRLRTGVFWYYLEEIRGGVRVQKDFAYPLTHMDRRELRRCCIRVLYYGSRVAVEIFHSVTDGTGGLLFLRCLAARYAELRYGAERRDGLPDPQTEPEADEIADCFPKYCGRHTAGGNSEKAYLPTGTPSGDGFRTLTTGICPSGILVETAHHYRCTVTAFLCAVMAEQLAAMQTDIVPEKKHCPVCVTVPVDLRRLYGERTLRNFVLTVDIGFDPRDGEYSLEEICAQMTHQLAYAAVPQKMAAQIAANVRPQQMTLVRVMPLAIKNGVMRLVYRARGERGGCINISNLGTTELPDQIAEHVRRMDFIIGPQRSYPNNCSVLSYGGQTCINMIRSIRESELERRFFSRLVELGIPVTVECNERG